MTTTEGPHTKLTVEELGKWMNIANQNALEREAFAELAQSYREALEDIAEPMLKIQAEAKAEGMKINGGMANDLCQDANWLRDKARTALREVARGEERQADAHIRKALLDALTLLHRIALQTPALNNPDDREVIDKAWEAIRLAELGRRRTP